MSRTVAVPLDVLATANHSSTTGQPLCPRCKVGYLHPHKVEIGLGGWGGAHCLIGWVAVCVGTEHENRAVRGLYATVGNDVPVGLLSDHEPCGFSMPLTA